MNSSINKLKILYLNQIFEDFSDSNHVFNAIELCEILKSYSIKAERKSIYDDIDTLKEFGVDIVKTNKPKRGFYLNKRKFDMAEVRLLTDAVQAAKFISTKNTKELLYKIGGLLSENQQEIIRKQIYVDSKTKCSNEQLYETITVLNDAIEAKKQVSFNYSKRKIENNFLVESEKKFFTVSPYAMIWSDDHYYLVCNNAKYNNLMHVRLERISGIQITALPSRNFSCVSEYKNSFNSADYAKKLFNMYSGETGEIQLKCSNEIVDIIIEKFGEDCKLKADGNNHFIVKATVELSDGLVSWIMQHSTNMIVLQPPDLRQKMIKKISEMQKMYE